MVSATHVRLERTSSTVSATSLVANSEHGSIALACKQSQCMGSKQTSTDEKETDETVLDLVVVGAGPHALSLIAKLAEPRVDPNEEVPQNRTLFKQSNKGVIKARYDTEPSASAGSSLEKDLRRFESRAFSTKQKKRTQEFLQRCMVLDANGEWMSQWHKQFETLNIPMLRSPISAHPDPIDREMLRMFAEKHKRRGLDTIDLDIDRSKDFHGPYEVPTTGLFERFCRSVESRYKLDAVLRQAYVTRIVPLERIGEAESNQESTVPLFEIITKGEERLIARNVVVAVGSLNTPSLPQWASEARETYSEIPEALESLLHSNDIITKSKDHTSVLNSSRRLLIVGGGLTAGHLALKALHSNTNARVCLISRRNLIRRQFDLELKWMGMKRTNKLAEFWSVESMEERMSILRQSKNGGSISPEVFNDLLEFEAIGRLELLENAEVVDAQWDRGGWMATLSNGRREAFEAIWCATGTATDFCTEPLFVDLCEFAVDKGDPIDVVGGFPVLTEDLRIHKHLNVFVMGMYAGLRVGPGALNVMGGNAAASRIAHALDFGLRGPRTQTTWHARSSKRQ